MTEVLFEQKAIMLAAKNIPAGCYVDFVEHSTSGNYLKVIGMHNDVVILATMTDDGEGYDEDDLLYVNIKFITKIYHE